MHNRFLVSIQCRPCNAAHVSRALPPTMADSLLLLLSPPPPFLSAENTTPNHNSLRHPQARATVDAAAASRLALAPAVGSGPRTLAYRTLGILAELAPPMTIIA